jgi:hypothetical protein
VSVGYETNKCYGEKLTPQEQFSPQAQLSPHEHSCPFMMADVMLVDLEVVLNKVCFVQVRVELVFCVCCLCLFCGGGAAHLCTPPLPRLARFLWCISLHFPCLSLPFAMFPAALAPGMPGTPAPGKKQGKWLTGTQQSGLGTMAQSST